MILCLSIIMLNMLGSIANAIAMVQLVYHFGTFNTDFHFISYTLDDNDLLTKFEDLLGQNWFQGLFSILAVIVTIGVYAHEQNKLRKETIIRSCESILREIQENVESLTAGKYERITYSTNKNSSSIEGQIVNYTNAYLDIDAYESVLFSGSFTHFSAATQHTLTMLYSRIRKRNELITYTEHFEDTFFINSHDHEMERKEMWFKTIMKYDILLTRYEGEVLHLLSDVKPMIEKEKSKHKKTFLKEMTISKEDRNKTRT